MGITALTNGVNLGRSSKGTCSVSGSESSICPPVSGLGNMSQTTARRGELKYLLNGEVYGAVMKAIQPYTEYDAFPYSPIRSLYYDTQNNAFIRRSVEKPRFKEKVRVRTYDHHPREDESCLIELKRKVNETVYKRRVSMPLAQAHAFLVEGKRPTTIVDEESCGEGNTLQILDEIQWLTERYGSLRPTFTVMCERLSLKERETESLRITFDHQITWSHASLGGHDVAPNRLLEPGFSIMEVKSTGGLPFWLVEILDSLSIYPRPFSKVGASYLSWVGRRNAEIRDGY